MRVTTNHIAGCTVVAYVQHPSQPPIATIATDGTTTVYIGPLELRIKLQATLPAR